MKIKTNYPELKIVRLYNAFVLHSNQNGEGKKFDTFQAYEFEQDDSNEKDALQKLFCDVMDYLSVFNDKRDAKRLSIEVVEVKEE